MNDRILHISDYISNHNRGLVSYINNPIQLRIAHSHDYFELFLVNKGHAMHYVNGFTQPLSPAILTFVRPNDNHHYKNMSKDFEIINILIPSEIINDIFAFLGSGFSPERLLSISFSPSVQISQSSFKELLTKLEQLVLFKKIMKEKVDSLFRITIMNIITNYFPINFTESRDSVPVWFKWLTLEMQKNENFVEGLPAMHRLSGKTIEHMTRICRKSLGKTPTQFINEVRAANTVYLLISTNKKIVDICYEVGFNNLSNYYHLFHSLYGMTPLEMRKSKDTEEVMKKIYASLVLDSNIAQGIPFR